jgi:TnpA family transposase
VNDFLYYLIGKIHAPCYRSTAKKTKTISGFKSLIHYNDLLIQPSRRVNKKLIKKKWPELVPILVSLLSHTTNQENIIKTLSSHEYKSDVKEALWELNNILKSIHLLKYIDDPHYRRDIRTALNRGEAYHQLLGKIQAIGGGDFCVFRSKRPSIPVCKRPLIPATSGQLAPKLAGIIC